MTESQEEKRALRSSHPELSVVMPCYNEGAHIEALVIKWLEVLRGAVSDFELVIVNDGSNDGTGRSLDGLRREHPEIRVVHQLHIGHGRAVRRGYETARGRYVLQVDSSGRYDPSDFLRMWRTHDQYHLILGQRTHRLDSWPRRVAGAGLKTLLRWLFGIRLHDPNVPFRLYSRVALVSYLKALPPNTDDANLILTVLIASNYPDYVKELPIPFKFRPLAGRRRKLRSLPNRSWLCFQELLRLRLSPARRSTPFLATVPG
ncbi:MAG: glycosyltransferase family 2 protein [Bdellovibrionaceae bacterium]|nr:glycosyltransferase family 2 protein [Bdellovibrionales bacterium]MCB9254748.1 glycosyltransferase family 2 protein [Pseudobdellovibrionaceae bacterium]